MNKLYKAADYFTDEQLDAIYREGNNILVSAAAGCGKTTLMVQRIIRKIIDDKVSVNQLIVVTFTEAAAAELKVRLEAELNETIKKIDDQETIAFLNHQLDILNDSYISTFHALCLRLLKENKAEFNFDKPITIGDARVLLDLKKKAFDTLFNNHYYEKEFQDLDGFFNPIQSEDNLFAMLDNILSVVISKGGFNVVESTINSTNSESISDYEPYFSILRHATNSIIMPLGEMIEEVVDMEGHSKKSEVDYNNFLERINNIKTSLQSNFDYNLIYQFIEDGKPRKITTKIMKANDHYQYLNNQIDDLFKKKLAKLYVTNQRNLIKLIQDNDYNLLNLLKYVKLYEGYLLENKLTSGYLEFDDLENQLIDLFYNEDGTTSETANSLKGNFNEIMIDEYQDTSLVQERIVKAISSGHNIFMVGDIKQSIYRFRNATSALFAEKYKDYSTSDKGYLIELSANFRSLPGVLESTNYIFKNVFSTNLGGIEYDKGNQLNFGNKGLLKAFPDKYITEVILNTHAEDSEGKNFNKKDKWALSSQIAVNKIQEMVDTKGLNYNDFVILTRNRKGWDELERAFKAKNIDYMMHGLSGFFKTYEIKDLLNLLTFLANKKDDVALIGVLHSYFCNLNEADILQISSIQVEGNKYASLIDKLALSNYVNEYNLLDDLLLKSYTLTPSDLIDYIYEVSPYKQRIYSHNNYESFLMAITRFKNLVLTNMDYYNNLDKLLQGIDDALNNSKDDDSVATLSSEDNVVNVMTIHKSKGLEFKYVILLDEAELSKATKITSDRISTIENKIILPHFDTKEKIRLAGSNPIKPFIEYYDEGEIISEELRILYVALTRAKLQLIIIRTISEEQINDIAIKANKNIDWLIPETSLRSLKYMSDFIIAAFTRHKNGLSLRNGVEASPNDDVFTFQDELFEINIVQEELEETTEIISSKEAYPYQVIAQDDKPAAMYDSVRPSDHGQTPIDFQSLTDYDPFYMGNMTHLLFENIDFNSTDISKEIETKVKFYNVSKTVQAGVISFVENEFFNTIKNNHYIKEYSFIYQDKSTLMNGIIDLYVETDNDIYIIDYKSDKLDSEQLIDYYAQQLNTYEKVISKQTNKNIRKLIYSVYNKQFIEV